MKEIVKNFDQWNDLKKRLDLTNCKTITFQEREVWWCSIGLRHC